jgi:hypothetical protein
MCNIACVTICSRELGEEVGLALEDLCMLTQPRPLSQKTVGPQEHIYGEGILGCLGVHDDDNGAILLLCIERDCRSKDIDHAQTRKQPGHHEGSRVCTSDGGSGLGGEHLHVAIHLDR